MTPRVLTALKEGAEQLAAESDNRADALQYADDLAADINADLELGYEKGSDSWGVLYKACYSAIWEATKSCT